MTFDAYRYVGPSDIKSYAVEHPTGTAVNDLNSLIEWLRNHVEAGSEGATFVVNEAGVLRLAPRRSEHVACSEGKAVLAAGEIRFDTTPPVPRVAYLSNQSTGYCPDVASIDAVRVALARLGVESPERFTRPFIFRRCEACSEIGIVKEDWYVCVYCNADLPPLWNVSERFPVEIQGL